MEKMKKINDKKRSGRSKKLGFLDKKTIKKNIYQKMGDSLRKITYVLDVSKKNIKICVCYWESKIWCILV